MKKSTSPYFDQAMDYLRQVLNGCIPEGLPKSTSLAALGITLVFQMYLQGVGWPFASVEAVTGAATPNVLFPIILGAGAATLLVAIFRSGGGIMDAVLYWLCGYLIVRDPLIQWPESMYYLVLGAWLWSTVVLALYAVIVRPASQQKAEDPRQEERPRRRRFFDEAFIRRTTPEPAETAEVETSALGLDD